MSILLNTADVMTVDRYPFKSPNPSDTVDSILKQLDKIEKEIDSPQVNAEKDEIVTTSKFFGSDTKRKCFNIKLRDTDTPELKKFGAVIYPVVFGNLVYLVKYEYLKSWFGFISVAERNINIRKKLTTIDKYNEYIFIQTLSDFVFCELIKKNDPKCEVNMKLYAQFMSVGAR